MPDTPDTKTTEIHPFTIDIAQWTSDDSGGHSSAHQVPELLSADIREFFDGLR